MNRVAVVIASVFLLFGCQTVTTAKQHAVHDLECPDEDVAVEDLGINPRAGHDDVFRATGCSGLAYYSCNSEQEECVLVTPDVTLVTATIAIDGADFVPGGGNVCDTGTSEGFFGVDLQDARGWSLRLIQDPATGAGTAAYIAPDGRRSPAFTSGVDLVVDSDGLEVNGHAHLSCDLDGHTVEGDVTFTGCRALRYP